MTDVFKTLSDMFIQDHQYKSYIKEWNDEKDEEDEYEKETFEVIKGEYKTIIECTFHKNGILANVHSTTEVNSKELENIIIKLKIYIDEAVKNKDYKSAYEFDMLLKEKERILRGGGK